MVVISLAAYIYAEGESLRENDELFKICLSI